jgi:voltage-gated potassium channel
MDSFRRRILSIIEQTEESGIGNKIYAFGMFVVIVASMIPLAAKEPPETYRVLETVTFIIFVVDYLLRLGTADLRMKQGAASFLRYPLGPLAVCDLLAILSYLIPVIFPLHLLRLLRLIRGLKVLRIFKSFRIVRSISMILEIIREQRSALIAVCLLAVGYVFICALVIFNVEPETFPTFFDAVYWATVSLTTVGYGDIYPVSPVGRVIAMLSSVFGIAIIALPSGIITAGFLDRIRGKKDD